MKTLCLIGLINIFLTLSPINAETLKIDNDKTLKFGQKISFLEGETYLFSDLYVIYQGSILETGHDKFTSEAFQVSRGDQKKKIIIPPLSLYGKVFRLGMNFYEIKLFQNKTFTINKPGFWQSFLLIIGID